MHFATLIAVLLFQKYNYFHFSEYIIYPENNLRNFILHLFLVQNWGFNYLFNIEIGFGFNAPSWPLSIELFLYIAFFIISTRFIRNFNESLIFLIILTFLLLINQSIDFLFAGFFLFFLGGTVYYFTEIIKKYLTFNKKKIFGDLSYTIYLIHIPLQILIIYINNRLFNIEFNNNYFFILFFLLIFLISYLIYKYYESPFKIFIRNKLIKNNIF